MSELNRKQLLRTLKIVEPITAKGRFRSMTPLLANVCFKDGEVSATDINHFIKTRFDAGANFLLQPKGLINHLTQYKTETVKFDIEDTKVTVKDCIAGQESSYNIATVDCFPMFERLDEIDSIEWIPIPDEFLIGLKKTMPFITKQNTNLNLCQVIIDGNNIVATDNCQMGWYRMNHTSFERFAISGKLVKYLFKIGRPTHIAFKDCRLYFKYTDTLFGSWLLPITYPEWRDCFPQEDSVFISKDVTLDKETISETLKKVESFLMSVDEELIEMSKVDDKLVFRSSNNGKDVEEFINGNLLLNDKLTSVYINPKHLINALKVCNTFGIFQREATKTYVLFGVSDDFSYAMAAAVRVE